MTNRERFTALLLGLVCSLLLFAAACRPVNPSPTGAGGTPSIGGSAGFGASNVGGWLPIWSAGAGGVETGGSAATGGAVPYPLPTCPTRQVLARKAAPQHLTGWRPDPTWRTQLRAVERAREFAPERTAVWRTNLRSALNQGSVGACVGFGCAGIASTQPFRFTLGNSDGLVGYGVATRIDQGCSPLGGEACPGSYPPTDEGSYSSSGMRAGVALGWWRSWSPVPDVPTLIQRLQKGPCGIGKAWHEDEFYPSIAAKTCGRLSQTGKVVGGHFMALPRFYADVTPRRFVAFNSWGNDWGACDGELCGFAYIDEPDLVRILATGEGEIVCPDPPGGG